MRYFIFFILFIVPQKASSQDGTYEKFYNTEDGLNSDIVYGLEQDNDGYLWIVTEAGLNRYNGDSFKNYTVADGLPHNEIVSINKDCKGRLWLNSNGPLSYIEEGVFKTVGLPLRQELNMNYQVACHDSLIWHVSGKKLSILNNDLSTIKDVPKELKKNPFYVKILNEHNDSLWINTGSKIYIIKGLEVKDSITISEKLDQSYAMPFAYIYSEPNIYYTFEKAFYQYNRKTKSNSVIDSNIEVSEYMNRVVDDIFIYHQKGGYSKYHINENSDLEFIENVSNGLITTKIINDSEGNSWQSYYNQGIAFRPKPNSHIYHITANEQPFLRSIQSLLWTDSGLWIGNAEAQIIRYLDDEWKIFNLPNFNKFGITRILDIKEFDEGSLLISSDVGLYLFKDEKLSLVFSSAIKKISILNEEILINTHSDVILTTKSCIEEIANGDMSLSKSDLYFQLDCFKKIVDGRSFSGAINVEGQKLIGSVAQGLIRIDHNGRYDFKNQSNLINVNINEIVSLNDSTFLVGTKGQGLFMITDDNIRVINRSNGLTSDIIYDILVADSTVYLATNNGLNIIDNIYLEDKIIIKSLKRVNGLLKNEIKGIELKDGLLYIASMDGLSFLNVSQEDSPDEVDRVVIDNVIVNAEEIPISKTIKLESHQTNIVIQFANLNYLRTDDTNYAYRLRGIDDEWRITQSREVSYNNIEPDNYIFELTHAAGLLDEKPVIQSISIDIEVPFAKTNLAKFLFSILAIGLIYLLFYAINSKKNMDVLEQKVKERTKSLSIKIDEIDKINQHLKRSNQELQDYAYATSHDLKSPLRTISSFVTLLQRKNEHRFNEKDREYVGFITKGIKRMNQVVQDLLDLSKVSIVNKIENVNSKIVLEEVLEDLQFEISQKNVKISRTGSLPLIRIEPTKLKQLFQNLIANAIKYNDNKEPMVLVNSRREDDHNVFEISDNGIGIDEQYRVSIFDIFKRLHSEGEYEGTGIGLAICKKIVDNYNGKIYCQDGPNGGTSFIFKLPVDL